MTFTELIGVILPAFLQIAGIVLIVVFIILGIKLIKTVDKLNIVIDDVNTKIESVNNVFDTIDRFNNRLSNSVSKLFDGLLSTVLRNKKNKYNDDEEE